MLNILWAAMIIMGIVYASFTGNIAAVSDGILASAKEAVSLCITMLGVVSLWSGLMQIALKAGLILKCTNAIMPVMRWLFPRIEPDSEAMQCISANVIANIFGLGWAATPAGLKAMKALAVIEEERGSAGYTENTGNAVRSASNEMCTFLVLNISSLQLIPVNMIAYRQQYGSVNPTGIVAPAIAATFISTVIAVIYCKIKCIFKQ